MPDDDDGRTREHQRYEKRDECWNNVEHNTCIFSVDDAHVAVSVSHLHDTKIIGSKGHPNDEDRDYKKTSPFLEVLACCWEKMKTYSPKYGEYIDAGNGPAQMSAKVKEMRSYGQCFTDVP